MRTLLLPRRVTVAAFLFATTSPVLAQVPLSGVVSDSTTGPLQSGVVYHASSIQLPAGQTLTVEDDVVVKFQAAARFDVAGDLRVQGSSFAPTVFTDIRDDTAGGDTNADGNATVPTPGSWRGLVFADGATGAVNELELRYTGQAGVGVNVRDARVAFSRCRLRDGQGVGWRLNNLVTLSTLFHCEVHDTTGVAFDRVAMEMVPNFVQPVATGNGTNAVRVETFSLSTDLTVGPSNGVEGGILVQPAGFGRFTIPAGRRLTLSPGTALKFPTQVELDVQGTLIAGGTVTEPVVLTDARDDTVGGDTNNDGPANPPRPGGWARLVYGPAASASAATFMEVRFAGGNGVSAVRVRDSAPTFTDCTVTDSPGAGVELTVPSRPSFTRVHVQNAGGYPFEDVPLEAIPGFLDCTSSGTQFEAPNVTGGFAGSVVDEAITIEPRNTIGGVLRIQTGVTIEATGSVEIRPGVVLKHAVGAFHRIDGVLECAGVATNPVWFTSEFDDAIGGDTNNDGAMTAPAPGDWDSLLFRVGSDDSTVRHARLRYAGGGVQGIDSAVSIRDSAVTIEDTEIAHTDGPGMDLNATNAEFRVHRCLVRDSVGAAAFTEVHWNTVDHFLDNVARDNRFDRMEVNRGQVIDSVDLSTRNCIDDQLYVATSIGGGPVVGLGGSMTVRKGVIFKMEDDTRFLVDGSIDVQGGDLGGIPVTFTHVSDDTVGTDIEADGNATAPSPGDWIGVEVGARATALVHGALIRYGSPSQPGGAFRTRLDPMFPPPLYSVTHTRVEHSGSCAYFLESRPRDFERNVAWRASFGVISRGFTMLGGIDQCTFVFIDLDAYTPSILPPDFRVIKFRNSITMGRVVGFLDPFSLGGSTADYSSMMRFLIFSNIGQVPLPGVGQVVLDPAAHFVDAQNGDFRLAPNAPQIDTGDPAFPTDTDGTRSDMGAYEFTPCEARVGCTQAGLPLGGCEPTLELCGIPSLSSPKPFEMILRGVPNGTAGIAFWGTPSGTSPVFTPYGNICVTGPTRTGVLFAEGGNPLAGPCHASMRFDFNEYVQSTATGILAGSPISVAFWYRDGNATNQARFSDSAIFVMCP